MTFNYLWARKEDQNSLVLVSWENIFLPKTLGGWGLKNIHLFTKSLETKNRWNLINNNKLWFIIFKGKYFPNDSYDLDLKD